MHSEKGFLYVANKEKFVEEALISLRSLRRYHREPVALVCTPDLVTSNCMELFDVVIPLEALSEYTYMAKVLGMQHSPFERTVFLDGDTFITDHIGELFDILDIVDFAATAEDMLHTSQKMVKTYREVFPEFHTGVLVYRNSEIMKELLRDWLRLCNEQIVDIDMPGFREAVLLHFNAVRFSVLPPHYNMHGFSTMLILHAKVKVIHERLNYRWGYVTPYFGPFEFMDAFAKQINKQPYKRLYIPKVGIIPYNYSPANMMLYLKKKLKFKRVSKNK